MVAGVTDITWPPAWDGYLESEIQLMRLPDENAALAWRVNRWGADGSGFLVEPFDLPEPFTEGFRQGVTGYAQDICVQGRPWPFDPGRISAPIHFVHGEQDTIQSSPSCRRSRRHSCAPGATDLRVI